MMSSGSPNTQTAMQLKIILPNTGLKRMCLCANCIFHAAAHQAYYTIVVFFCLFISSYLTKEPEVCLRLFSYLDIQESCPLSEVKFTVKPGFQLTDRYADLLHAVPVTDRDGLIRLGIEIVCDA